MNYSEFVKTVPDLYGQIIVKGKVKIGGFKSHWNKFTNSLQYFYYTEKGNRGKGGFTLKRAYNLLQQGSLSTDPQYGKKEFYI